MGNKIKLPGSFIRLPVIQEALQEDVCKFCEIHIIEGSRNTQFYSCEGSRCQEALDLYEEQDYIEYEFIYTPSKEIQDKLDSLDKKIRQLATGMGLDICYLNLIGLKNGNL